MDNIEIKNNIREILNKLDKMPYGVETHNKTLPPNARHYEQLVIQLIENLLQIKNENVIEVVNKIQSIRNNQLRELLLNNNNSFERYGVNEEMMHVTHLIQMHTDCIF